MYFMAVVLFSTYSSLFFNVHTQNKPHAYLFFSAAQDVSHCSLSDEDPSNCMPLRRGAATAETALTGAMSLL